MRDSRHFAVIGRGIAGLTVACRLLERGMQVTVIAPERCPGEASNAALGMNVLKGARRARSPLYECKRTAHELLWQRLIEIERATRVNIPRIRGGIFEPFFSETERQKILQRVFHRPAEEFDQPELVARSDAEFSTVFSDLRSGVDDAFAYAADYWYSPQTFLRAMSVYCTLQGGRCIARPVDHFTGHGENKWRIAFGSDEFFCDEIVLAAGIFTDELLRRSEFASLPFQSVAGQILTAPVPSTNRAVWLYGKRNLIYCDQTLWYGAHDLLKNQPEGELEGLRQPLPEACENLRAAVSFFPKEIDVHWGVRAFFKDRMPVVGSLGLGATKRRIWLSAGYHRSGTQIADYCAQSLVDQIFGQPALGFMQSFAPDRLLL